MAGSKEQQARYRWCVYRVRRRLEDEFPETFYRWWEEAQQEWEEGRGREVWRARLEAEDAEKEQAG